MKKIIVSVFIILIFLRPLHAQYLVHTQKNMSGTWNSYTKKYTYGEVNSANITFQFHNKYISANDNSKSIYRITKKSNDILEDDYKIFGWDCLDEQNRSCSFSITKYYDPNTPDIIMIIYPKFAYIYFIHSVENENE